MMSSYWNKDIVHIVADILSLITVSSCLVIKVPQIQTVRLKKSSQGISAHGLYLELFSYTVMFYYNYCSGYEFLSYMEYPILLVQEYVLIYYVLLYQDLIGKKTQTVAAIYVVVAILVYFRVIGVGIFSLLVPFCTPIGATSKVLQCFAILRTKDASSVSRTTWALSAFTNMTRIYTVYFQSHDWMLLSNFIISTFLSSSVFLLACIFKEGKKLKIK